MYFFIGCFNVKHSNFVFFPIVLCIFHLVIAKTLRVTVLCSRNSQKFLRVKANIVFKFSIRYIFSTASKDGLLYTLVMYYGVLWAFYPCSCVARAMTAFSFASKMSSDSLFWVQWVLLGLNKTLCSKVSTVPLKTLLFIRYCFIVGSQTIQHACWKDKKSSRYSSCKFMVRTKLKF